MLFNTPKPLLAGCIIAFLSFQTSIDAFGVTGSLPRTYSSTSLQAERGSRRRDFFDAVKRGVLGAGAVAAMEKVTTPPAFAEDSTAGKIVTLQVANIDGEPEKTGTLRIQLRPEWAPRGVARFEVCAIFGPLVEVFYRLTATNSRSLSLGIDPARFLQRLSLLPSPSWFHFTIWYQRKPRCDE
jgi:hypothetical protein